MKNTGGARANLDIWGSAGGEAGQRQRLATKVTSAQLSWEYKEEGKKVSIFKGESAITQEDKMARRSLSTSSGSFFFFFKTEVQGSGMDEPQSNHLDTGYAKKRKENWG